MSDFSDKETATNIHAVRAGIYRKQLESRGVPYMATNKSILPVINDMDHIPYTRWYRGVYYSDTPIIAEREAGWRHHENGCYSMTMDTSRIPIENFHGTLFPFELPCSTIQPSNISDKRLCNVIFSGP